MSLLYLGEEAELRQRLPAALQDAEDRGDVFSATHLQMIIQGWIHLLDDEPDQTQSNLERVLARWSQRGSFLQHFLETMVRLWIALYRGETRTAWDLVKRTEPTLARSLLMQNQHSRLVWWILRLGTGLRLAASLPGSAERRALLRSTERDIRRIDREDAPWCRGQALLGRAGLAELAGQRTDSVTKLSDAEGAFRAADMMLHAMAVRRRRGLILGGDEGQALVQEADAWMTAQTIRNPAAWSHFLAGFDK